MKTERLFFVLFLVLSVFISSDLFAASIGEISVVRGRVFVLSPGEPARAASLGEPVYEGDMVLTEARSRAQIDFHNGHVVRISGNSRLKLEEFVETEQQSRGLLSLLGGKIESIVKRVAGRAFGRDRQNRFEVQTPTAVCGVRGTRFFTWYIQDISGAAVEEGELYAFSKNRPDEMVFISAGQAMEVVDEDTPPQVKDATEEEMDQHEEDTNVDAEDVDDAAEDVAGDEPSGDLSDEEAAEAEDDFRVQDQAEDTSGGEVVAGDGSAKQDIEPEIDEEGQAQFGGITDGDGDIPGDNGETAGSVGIRPGELLESGSVDMTIDETTRSGSLSLSGTGDPPARRTQSMSFGGPLDDGSECEGLVTGVLGSWKGIMAALALGVEGELSILSGVMEGTWTDRTLSAAGDVFRSDPLGYISLLPSDLSAALTDPEHYAYAPEFDSLYLPVLGEIVETGQFLPGSLQNVESVSIGLRTDEGRLVGVWGVSDVWSAYSSPVGAGMWTGFFGDVQDTGNEYFPSGYAMGYLSGRDDGASQLEIEGELAYLGPGYLGEIHLAYVGTPDHFGHYDAAGAGTWEGTPLTFATHLSGDLKRLLPGTLQAGRFYNPLTGYGGFFSHNWNKKGWRKYHDGTNYYYEFVSTPSGGAGYRRTYDLDAETGETYRYHPSGTYIHFAEHPVPAVIESFDAWDIDHITDLADPPSRDYKERFQYQETRPSNLLVEQGGLNGIMAGTGDLWAASEAAPAAVTGMGEVTDSRDVYGIPLITSSILSRNPVDGSCTTMDGGAYAGFIGGLGGPAAGDEGPGLIYGLYMDPLQGAGILKGSFQSRGHEAGAGGMGMWEMTGGMYPAVRMSDNIGMAPSALEDNMDYGGMRIWNLQGDFSGRGYVRGQGVGGGTASIAGQDWGVFRTDMGYDTSFHNPEASPIWRASFPGAGEFGKYENQGGWTPDFGYFQAYTDGGAWSDNIIQSGLSGTFITLTKTGEMDGRLLGSYDSAAGAWQGLAMGDWRKTSDLVFSGILSGEGYMSRPRRIYSYRMEDGSHYEFGRSLGGESSRYAAWLYFRNETDGTTFIEDYYADGSMERMAGIMGSGTLQEYFTGTYDFPLEELESPDPETYGDTVAYKTYEEQRLRARAWYRATLGGLNELWDATSSDRASVVLMGEYGYYYEDLHASFVFGEELKSYDPYTGAYMTPDGGAYLGYAVGRLSSAASELDGRFYGVYVDPDNNAGRLLGSFAGSADPEAGILNAQGGMFPELVTSDISTGITAETLNDQGNLAEGYMRIFGLSGDFGYAGSYVKSDTRYPWPGSEEHPGGTVAIRGEPWGAFYFLMGRDNTFGNPEAGSAWSAKTGGLSEFGSWYNPSSQAWEGVNRYWLADITGGTWVDGKIYGELAGKMQSHGSMGALTGEVLGAYDVSGKWEAVGTGAWSLTSKRFGSSTSADLLHGSFHHWGGVEYSDGASYHYNYSKDDAWANAEYKGFLGQGSYDKSYYIDTWWDAGFERIRYETGQKDTYAAWDPATFDFSSLSHAPDPAEGETVLRAWNDSGHSHSHHGYMSGRMGGTQSLWTTTDTPVEFLGEYWNQRDRISGVWDMKPVHSWNYLNDTCTDYDDPAGSYYGLAAGIHIGGVMEGGFLAVYIDPRENAGFLRGDLSGNAYQDVGMYEMAGELNREQVLTAAGSGLKPEELYDSIEHDEIHGALAGSFENGKVIRGAVRGDTYEIEPSSHNGTEWGIVGIRVFGGHSRGEDPSPNWSAALGGHLVDDWNETKWVGHITDGNLSGQRMEGTLSGRYLGPDVMGAFEGGYLGTYDSGTHNLEGVSLSTFQGEPLSFMNLVSNAEIMAVGFKHEGYWESPDDDSYYYYEYGAEGIWGHMGRTTDFDDETGITIDTYYYRDGTTEIKDSSMEDPTYGTWDPDTLDLSTLAESPYEEYMLEWENEFAVSENYGWVEGRQGGVDSLWGGNTVPTLLMGTIIPYEDESFKRPAYLWYEHSAASSWNSHSDTHTTYDGGAYELFQAGTLIQGNSYTLDGLLGGIYIDPSGGAGILSGRFGGSFEAGIEMFEADGVLQAYGIKDDSGMAPGDLKNSLVRWDDSEPFSPVQSGFVEGDQLTGHILLDERHEMGLHLPGENWGVSQAFYAGSYEGPVKDDWVMSLDFEMQESGRRWTEIVGTKLSDNKLEARGSGAWVSWDQAVTEVAGGELVGIFDPSRSTWGAVSIWNHMETGKFMELAQTEAGRGILQGLNIPCIEVGKATLAGSDDVLSVTMNDVTFFSYSTSSAPPRIWATDDVFGSYLEAPDVGRQVELSGDGLNADFEVRRWEGNKWAAEVSGGGLLDRSDGGGSVDVNFKGGAAGDYAGASSGTGGTLEGTGAGVVVKP